jgi:hypothetical protein
MANESDDLEVSEGLIVRKEPDHIIVPTEKISSYTSIRCTQIM